MSRRRFRIGAHPDYDRRFDGHKLASQILNPMGNQVSWLVFEMGDEHGVSGLLQEYKAKLAYAEKVVAQCDQQFENLKAARANQGRATPRQRDRREELEFMDALAVVDVTGEEVDRLQTLLGKFTERRRATEAASVLKYGPVGIGKLGSTGVLSVIDGQVVAINAEQLLVINDPRSPYHGMSVADYKEHLVRPWLAAHKRTSAVDRASLPPWPAAVPRPTAGRRT